MPQRTIRRVFILLATALVSAIIAPAQSSITTETLVAPESKSWQDTQSVAPSKGKVFVVTIDQPNRRQTCRIQSFTLDQLVCSRAFGGPRTYRPQQIAAIILPGDDGLRIRLVLGFNAGLGTAIWGTVVLAAACPACAVATGIAAFFCFSAAGATLYADGQPDRLLYVAPGYRLTGKLASLSIYHP